MSCCKTLVLELDPRDWTSTHTILSLKLLSVLNFSHSVVTKSCMFCVVELGAMGFSRRSKAEISVFGISKINPSTLLRLLIQTQKTPLHDDRLLKRSTAMVARRDVVVVALCILSDRSFLSALSSPLCLSYTRGQHRNLKTIA